MKKCTHAAGSYCKQADVNEDVANTFFKELYADGDKLRQDNFISSCITIQAVQRLRKVGEIRVRNERQFTAKFQVFFLIALQ